MTTPADPKTDAPRKQPSSGNAFTRKLGPLPVWAWMGIGLAIALAYYFIKQNKAGNANNAAASTADQTASAAQIPQFVNQVYTNETPPASPTTTTPTNPTTPPTNVPPANSYYVQANGKETLATIAKKQGVSESDIITNTEQLGGQSNHLAFVKWLQTSNNGKKGKVPAGIDLFLTASGPHKGRTKVQASGDKGA